MIKVNCCGCSQELNEQGAIILSPPQYPMGDVEKLHLCVPCWNGIREVIATGDYCVEAPEERDG